MCMYKLSTFIDKYTRSQKIAFFISLQNTHYYDSPFQEHCFCICGGDSRQNWTVFTENEMIEWKRKFFQLTANENKMVLL